jgi:hypothetical protein
MIDYRSEDGIRRTINTRLGQKVDSDLSWWPIIDICQVDSLVDVAMLSPYNHKLGCNIKNIRLRTTKRGIFGTDSLLDINYSTQSIWEISRYLMRPTSSSEIREAFLDFFEEMGHRVVPSSPLPVYDNPTLLFTNAGMNQFVDTFLGREKRSYSRAASSQKCMRVQGKHNDLENVGPSPRHHTFFEMLGNFSFGDYFKSRAIRFAYDFLTKVCEIPEDRLWYTVHEEDADAYSIWIDEIGVAAQRVLRMGDATNFWMMGDVGRAVLRVKCIMIGDPTIVPVMRLIAASCSTTTAAGGWRSGTWSSCNITRT